MNGLCVDAFCREKEYSFGRCEFHQGCRFCGGPLSLCGGCGYTCSHKHVRVRDEADGVRNGNAAHWYLMVCDDCDEVVNDG